jgi:hypothetical protein
MKFQRVEEGMGAILAIVVFLMGLWLGAIIW